MTKRSFFQVIPAVHLFLIKDNQVLLLRRFKTGYEDGNYSVPAGHVEEGEGAIESMMRETREEIGLSIRKKDLVVSHVMHRQRLDEGNERIDFFFTLKNWQGEPKICEVDKCDELKWFDMDNLPPNIIPYVKKALESVRNNQLYSEFGWHEGEI